MVTHDVSVANICDEIYTLQDKKAFKKVRNDTMIINDERV